MKKLALTIALVLIGCQLAFAAASDQGCTSSGGQAAGCGGTTNNGGGGGQGGNANNSTSNTNTNGNINTNTADGGSAHARSTASANNGGVNVGGSTTKVHSYSFGSASAPAAAQTDSVNVGTFLGGVGFSQTSMYAKDDLYLTRVREACADGVLTKEECQTEQKETLKRLKKDSRRDDRRLPNIFKLLIGLVD